MSKEDKTKSRWNAGNERYPKAMDGALSKYRTNPDWRNGAKIIRRTK